MITFLENLRMLTNGQSRHVLCAVHFPISIQKIVPQGLRDQDLKTFL